MSRWRYLVLVVVLTAAAGFGVFVWPTPYQYLPTVEHFVLAVRVNRFTGHAEILRTTGWQPVSGP